MWSGMGIYGSGSEALAAAATELARRYLPPGRLRTELANEPPARALLDRAADAELLSAGNDPAAAPARAARRRPWGRWRAPACGSHHCPVVVVSPDDPPGRDPDGRARRAGHGKPPGSHCQQRGGIGREHAWSRHDADDGRVNDLSFQRPGRGSQTRPSSRGPYA